MNKNVYFGKFKVGRRKNQYSIIQLAVQNPCICVCISILKCLTFFSSSEWKKCSNIFVIYAKQLHTNEMPTSRCFWISKFMKFSFSQFCMAIIRDESSKLTSFHNIQYSDAKPELHFAARFLVNKVNKYLLPWFCFCLFSSLGCWSVFSHSKPFLLFLQASSLNSIFYFRTGGL